MTTQSITSADTCLNQVPAVFKLINKAMDMPEAFWAKTRDVVDFGGGKFDTFSRSLAKLGVRNFVYDPYNRSDEHNELVASLLEARPADVGICSNVLNVIKEPEARLRVLLDLCEMVQPGGEVFFTVHEGDKTSRGRKTSKGWQANRPTKNYLREIRKVFPGAILVFGKLIIAYVPQEE